MSQYLPKDGFMWFTGNLNVGNIKNVLRFMNDKSSIGLVLEVDVKYPVSLHDNQNDLPYLPEKIIPPGSKFPKLTAHFM